MTSRLPSKHQHQTSLLTSFLYTILLLYRSRELLVQKYGKTSLLLFWCPYMVTNVSVQCNGGLLPDIILLTLCGSSIGEPFQYHVEFVSL